MLSGTKGSGAIFFANCAMRCVFCQNFQISQPDGHDCFPEFGPEDMAREMLRLQDAKGCHNINLVSPTHFVPQIVRALTMAVPMGLRVPLVYNTNSYDSLAMLKLLDGIVDVYLPDIKYASDDMARKYSQAPGYVTHSRAAIEEMHRQRGGLVLDDDGVALSGVIVRHLVLPNGLAGSNESLSWLSREISPDMTVSIMSQYLPCFRATRVPLLSRRISVAEYAEVSAVLDELGMENGWVQDFDSADCYLPDFERVAHPFEN